VHSNSTTNEKYCMLTRTLMHSCTYYNSSVMYHNVHMCIYMCIYPLLATTKAPPPAAASAAVPTAIPFLCALRAASTCATGLLLLLLALAVAFVEVVVEVSGVSRLSVKPSTSASSLVTNACAHTFKCVSICIEQQMHCSKYSCAVLSTTSQRAAASQQQHSYHKQLQTLLIDVAKCCLAILKVQCEVQRVGADGYLICIEY
jgi:hypothetical protein